MPGVVHPSGSMNRRLPIPAAICLVILPCAIVASPPPLLTLERVLGDAEAVNLSVLISRESIAQSEQDVRSARSLVLPTVTGRASQFRRGGEGRPVDDFSAGLYAEMPLLDLRAFDSLRAVKMSVNVSRFRYEQGVQQVLAAVAGVFFEYRRDLAYESVIEADIERARVLLELARNRLLAGVATQIDVTRAEAELLTAEQARLQQRTITLASAMRLKRLLVLDLDAPVALDDFEMSRELDPALERLPLEAILERRADFQAADAERERLLLVRRAHARERTPSLDAVLQGGINSETPLDGREEEFFAGGLQVSVPIFEGNRIAANLRRTQSDIRRSEFNLRDLQNAIGAEYRIALEDVRSQLAQVVVAEKNLALAAEELRLARVRYEQGVADNRELIEAENRFASASFNRVRSLHGHHLARVELARVRGDVRLVLAERAPCAGTVAPSLAGSPDASTAPVGEPAP